MRKSTQGIIGICLVAALAIMIVALPVSGWKGHGMQNETGNMSGGQMYQNGTHQDYQQIGSKNTSCIREDCPNNGTPLRDGTRMKNGRGMGHGNDEESGKSVEGCGNQSRV